MKIYKAFKFIFLLSIFCFLFSARSAFAAELFFGAKNKDVGLGQKFEIGVFVNSQNESINAIQGNIIFPADSLQFEGFYTGGSTLTFWVNQPALTSPGTISFSGIIPGGFLGPKGYLFSVIFTAKEKGNTIINSSDEKILLNDGNGTETKVTKAPLNIEIVEKSKEVFTPLSDLTPPEQFQPQIGQNSESFGGKYFLAFAAQDKGSGIDHYEVMEASQLGSIRGLFSKENWVVAQSPYILLDQGLRSNIFVKAIDKAGNERVSEFKALRLPLWYENYIFWGILIIISIIFFGYRIWIRKRF